MNIFSCVCVLYLGNIYDMLKNQDKEYIFMIRVVTLDHEKTEKNSVDTEFLGFQIAIKLSYTQNSNSISMLYMHVYLVCIIPTLELQSRRTRN